MLNEFITNHGPVIFLGLLLLLVLSGIIFSGKKSRTEKPDPPSIFAPIRGMYVCYQCDTIFNTAQCPLCNEDAAIPLIHLTGSILENDRLAAVMEKLQGRSTWKLPTFQAFEEGQEVAPGYMPEVSNGGASEVPMTISALRPERSRELS